MKTIYKILIFSILFLISNAGFSQITIINAVAVDGDSDGYYGTVEIQFSLAVNDNELESSAITKNDWEFSLASDFSSGIKIPNSFYTDVDVIASDNDANDEYIRFTFGTQFASCNGPIYYRYTNGNPGIDDVKDTSNVYVLADFTSKQAADKASPIISGVSFSPVTGNVLKVGDVLQVTISAGETGLSGNTLSLNGKSIANGDLSDIGGGDYRISYTILEGDNDISDASVIPFSFELEDSYGNVSSAYTQATAPTVADDCPGIDANKPVISGVSFSPVTGNVLKIGDVLQVTISAGETGLSGNTLSLNGKSIANGDLSDIGGGDYQFSYIILEGDNDISDASVIPFSFVLEDAVGQISDTYTQTTKPTVADDCPGIDANKPAISGVLFSPVTGNVLKVGDVLQVTISAGETGLSGNTLSLNGKSIANGDLSDIGGGDYRISYTILEGDNDIGDASVIPFSFVLEDAVGQTSVAYTQATAPTVANDCPGIDATRPTISGVVFNPSSGVVGIGGTIDVDINLGETDLTPNNSISINGIAIADGDISVVGTTASFTYTVSEGDNDISDASVIPFSFELEDANGNLSDAYTQATAPTVADDCPGIDANKPVISGVSFSPVTGNILKIGDVLQVTISAGETGLVGNTLSLNGKSIANGDLSDIGGGDYRISYTILEGDNDIGDASVIPFSFVLEDAVGQTSVAYTQATAPTVANDCPGIDATRPTISGVVFNPSSGVVGIGGTIDVDINLGETDLTPNNSISINGIAIADGDISVVGTTASFTYTVSEGDDPISDGALLPFSFVLEDVNGNTSLAYDQTNITSGDCPGIDADRPIISGVVFTPGNGTVSGIDSTIDVSISTSVSESNLSAISISFNNKTISNGDVTYDVGTDTYIFTYTVVEGDDDISDATLIPFSFELEDVNGNRSATYTESNLVGDNCPGIDAVYPVISSVTFDPGSGTTVGIGGTIDVSISTSLASESDLLANFISINNKTIANGDVAYNAGTDTYIFTYTIAEGDDDVSDASLIPINFVLEDLGGNTSNAYTTSTAAACPGIDATRPIISGVTFSPGSGTIVGIGSTIDVAISTSIASESDLSANSISINNKTIANGDVTYDSGTDTYIFTYTVVEGDDDISDAALIPFSFVLEDASGGLSAAYTESDLAGDNCPGIDATKPVISGVTFSPGSGTIVGIGSTIDVAINTSAASESDLSANFISINNKTIANGDVVYNAGTDTYIFTYTIAEGNDDVSDANPIPINFVIEDASGNISDSYTTSLASNCPGIDANRPGINSVLFTPGNGNTSIIGETVRVDVTASNSEDGLSASIFSVNSVDVTLVSDGGGNYHANYIVASTNTDIDDGTKLPIQIVLNDASNNASATFTEADITIDNSPGIDGNKPEIDTVYSSAGAVGVLKVGDFIDFTIEPVVSELNLTFIPASYNGGTLGWSTSDGGNTYTARYTVEEGHTDQPTALQLANIIATDENGNDSPIYSFNDIKKTIDANTPSITNFTVPQSKMLLGDVIQATITVVSDTGKYILNSGNVAGFLIDSIEKFNNTTYYAYFTISDIGYDIQANQSYSVDNLVLADNAGNICSTYSKTISQLNDPIYTILPSGKVTGSYNVCAGDTVELKMEFTGSAPWEIKLNDGTTTSTVSGITESVYYHKIKSVNNTAVDADTIVYKINRLTDVNGNIKVNTGLDSAITYVHIVPDPEITYPADGRIYNISTDEDTLIGVENLGIFSGSGIFSGDGVLASQNKFMPSEAGLNDHDIVYTYTTEHACSYTDTITITVINASGVIHFPDHAPLSDYLYCDYESPFMITGENINSKPGSFKIQGYTGSAITNSNTDTAFIDPTKLSAGDYTVIYTYDDGGTIEIQEAFTIESVGKSIAFNDDVLDQCADYDTIDIVAINLYPVGGMGEFTFSGSGGAWKYNPDDSKHNSVYLLPDSILPGDYHVNYIYTTPNGCKSATIIDNFSVNPLPTVSFMINSLYNIDQGITNISGNHTGTTSVFTPLSFMSNKEDGTADFNPETAGLGEHTVTYTYTDTITGCENSTSKNITVEKANGVINSASGSFQYCYFGSEQDTIVGVANNSDGTDGTFFIDDNLITAFGKDSIILIPQIYGNGDHTIKFKYTNGSAVYNIVKSFNVDSIGNINFAGFEDEYCEDDPAKVEINAISPTGEVGINSFTGNGISLEDELVYFTPASNTNIGYNVITYTFERTYSGCSKSTSDSIKINKLPFVDFHISDSCFIAGDLIFFYSDTLLADNVVKWEWKLEGIPYSNDQNPSKLYTNQGPKSIELTLTTNKGCDETIDKNKFIGIKTIPDFTWANECFGETVNFEIITQTDNTNIENFKWLFGDGSTLIINDTTESSTHLYSSHGDYLVKLIEVTKTCGSDTVENTVPVRPKVVLSDNEYFQDFESGTTEGEGWVAEDLVGTQENTWEYGIPNGTKIDSASSGIYAWATNIDGNYSNNERSSVTSPCFDFTSLERPMLKFDYISASEKDRDGVVIQYTNEVGEWTTIGLPNQGVNWYNSVSISGFPAGQPFGWTGDGGLNVGKNKWKTARFWLDQVTGREGVRFRFVFGSNGDITDEGFAFDNIWLGERKRIVLLEHFTNTDNELSNQIEDEIIEPIVRDNPMDVVSVNYYTSFPTADNLNSFYPSGPSARALYYGVSSVPYSIVDGGERQFTYEFTDYLDENDIRARMLDDPKFSISVKQDVQDGKLVVSASVTATESIVGKDINIQTVIVEKSVIDGSNTYTNVLRSFLPDAAGNLIEQDWAKGDLINTYNTWEIPDEVNPDSLVSIVFAQDNDTKEVLQTGFTEIISQITSIDELIFNNEELSYKIYPNPVSDNLTFKLGKILDYDLNIALYNNIGVMVKQIKFSRGMISIDINMSELPTGIYYLQLRTNKNNIGSSKIIKSN